METLGRTPDIQRACAAALENWQRIVAERLLADGFEAVDADELACTVINTIEGAEVTAQVARDDRALRIAGRHLSRLIRSSR
ncbi:LmrA/YxaF family transcription factor [Actinoalloteichus hymeniacidonis]|uniref:LmrA/YxaF family transcription factor n=1 Tax=Actinoalloteichus hymeniacidonis TaxID=340345 RepID=UPI0035D40CC7